MIESPSPSPDVPPATAEELPLHPDPEVAATLAFDPVIRKIQRHDGWTPVLQREYIRRLAQCGTPQRACIEMGKSSTGIEALYKNPLADSFRAAWDQAVRIGRRARGSDAGPPHLDPVPGITRRHERDLRPSAGGGGRGWVEPDEEQEEVDEEAQFALLDNLFRKFLLKVQAERTARLAGQIVAADFYLRQITFVEIALDLIAEGLGLGAWQALAELRRGGHNIFELAETPMSRLLDAKRRAKWAEMGEPLRPEHPPQRYLVHHSARRSGGESDPVRETIALEPLQNLGKASPPPPGVDAEKWRGMEIAEQRLLLDAHYEAEAEAQAAWEAAEHSPGAQAAWEAAEHSAGAQLAWEAAERSALNSSPLEGEVGRSLPQGSIDE